MENTIVNRYVDAAMALIQRFDLMRDPGSLASRPTIDSLAASRSALGCSHMKKNWSDSFHLHFSFLIFVLAINSQAKAQENWDFNNAVTRGAITLCEKPDNQHCRKPPKPSWELSIGENVHIVEIRDGWARIDKHRLGDDGWARVENLAEMRQFKPISTWSRPGHVEANAGDSNIDYVMNRDGTFTYTEIEEDGKKTTIRARLYRYENILWARDTRFPKIGISSQNIFFITRKGKVCPQLYLSGFSDDEQLSQGCRKGTELSRD
jgi:hypothetical protein